MMTMEEYRDHARSTAKYPGKYSITGLLYSCLGLAGESGEVADKIKKVIRDDNGTISDTKKEDIAAELGDVLWYVCSVSEELGFTLEEVATMNVNKLKARMDNGTISGSGDNR